MAVDTAAGQLGIGRLRRQLAEPLGLDSFVRALYRGSVALGAGTLVLGRARH